MSRASFSRISSRLRRSFSCCHVIITSPPRPHHVPATSCHVPAAHGRPPGHHQVIIKQSRLRRSFSCCHVIITSPPRPRHIMSYPRRARPRSRHSSETACAGRLFGPRSRPPSHPVTSPLVTIYFESRPRHGGGGGTLCVISPAVATASSPSTKSCSAGRPGREPWVGALSCTARTTHHVCHQDCDPRDAGSPERFWRRPWRCLPGN